jgi:hypothetical protein
MKICLNLSGQIRLRENENLFDKINYFKINLKFDKLFMHVWLNDYLIHKDTIEKIQKEFNTSIIITDNPVIDNNLSKKFQMIKHHLETKANDLFYQFYGIQSVFQRSNYEDYDIFIRCRFDNIFVSEFKFNKYYDILKLEKPVALVPSGSDWCEGMADAFMVMNKSCSFLINNLIEDYVKLLEIKFPFHPETLLRSFFINLHSVSVYRIPYPLFINSLDDKMNEKSLTSRYITDDFCVLDDQKFIPKISNDEPEIWIENWSGIANNFEHKLFINEDNLPVKSQYSIQQFHKISPKYAHNNNLLDQRFLEENLMDPIYDSFILDSNLLEKQKNQLVHFNLCENKIYLQDLVILIITKIDSKHRLNNLKNNIQHLNNFFENKIIVCELDVSSKINFKNNFEKILINPITDGFDRNYAANIIYKKLNYKYVLNIETDVIFDPLGIKNCYDVLVDLNLTMAMPFNGVPIWLNEDTTNSFFRHKILPEIWKNIFNFSNITDKENLNPKEMNKNYAKHPGYGYLINIQKFQSIGGENEIFNRHGFDDYERLYRVLKFGNTVFWSDYFAYHMWHTRSNNTNNFYTSNLHQKHTYLNLVRMELDDYQKEITSWPGFTAPLNL